MRDGVCVSCPENCAQCSVEALGTCTSCLPGYYYATGDGACLACSQANCVSCTTNGCLVCRSGYTLSSTFTCQQECNHPCSGCLASNPSACTSCAAGYTYDSATNSCSPDHSCDTTFTCSNCAFGYSMKLDGEKSTC